MESLLVYVYECHYLCVRVCRIIYASTSHKPYTDEDDPQLHSHVNTYTRVHTQIDMWHKDYMLMGGLIGWG